MLLFRFSIEKLQLAIQNDYFIMIMLQYAKLSKFKRLKTQINLLKNFEAYCKVIENIFNLSKFRVEAAKMLEGISNTGITKEGTIKVNI
jgi:hypothetical protein